MYRNRVILHCPQDISAFHLPIMSDKYIEYTARGGNFYDNLLIQLLDKMAVRQ